MAALLADENLKSWIKQRVEYMKTNIPSLKNTIKQLQEKWDILSINILNKGEEEGSDEGLKKLKTLQDPITDLLADANQLLSKWNNGVSNENIFIRVTSNKTVCI